MKQKVKEKSIQNQGVDLVKQATANKISSSHKYREPTLEFVGYRVHTPNTIKTTEDYTQKDYLSKVQYVNHISSVYDANSNRSIRIAERMTRSSTIWRAQRDTRRRKHEQQRLQKQEEEQRRIEEEKRFAEEQATKQRKELQQKLEEAKIRQKLRAERKLLGLDRDNDSSTSSRTESRTLSQVNSHSNLNTNNNENNDETINETEENEEDKTEETDSTISPTSPEKPQFVFIDYFYNRELAPAISEKTIEKMKEQKNGREEKENEAQKEDNTTEHNNDEETQNDEQQDNNEENNNNTEQTSTTNNENSTSQSLTLDAFSPEELQQQRLQWLQTQLPSHIPVQEYVEFMYSLGVDPFTNQPLYDYNAMMIQQQQQYEQEQRQLAEQQQLLQQQQETEEKQSEQPTSNTDKPYIIARPYSAIERAKLKLKQDKLLQQQQMKLFHRRSRPNSSQHKTPSTQ